MSYWRHSAYLMPLLVAAASVFMLQLKADYLILGKKHGQEGISEKKVFTGEELKKLLISGGGEEHRPLKISRPAGRDIFPRPEKITLSLNTFPPDAYILVDRRGRGRSPLTLKDLAPGKHLVEIRKPGYTLQRVPVDLVTDERLTIKLRKEPRPRLVRLADMTEPGSAAPPGKQAKSAPTLARRTEPSPIHGSRRPKKDNRVAGLMRDPLGAEKLDAGNWQVF